MHPLPEDARANVLASLSDVLSIILQCEGEASFVGLGSESITCLEELVGGLLIRETERWVSTQAAVELEYWLNENAPTHSSLVAEQLIAFDEPPTAKDVAARFFDAWGIIFHTDRVRPNQRPLKPCLYLDIEACSMLRGRDPAWDAGNIRHNMYKVLGELPSIERLGILFGLRDVRRHYQWQPVSRQAFQLLDSQLLGTPYSVHTTDSSRMAEARLTQLVVDVLHSGNIRYFSNGAEPSDPFGKPGSLICPGAVCDAIAIIVTDGNRLFFHDRTWNCVAD